MIVTVEPFGACEPPAGFCDWTMLSWLGSLTDERLLADLEAGGLEAPAPPAAEV